MGPLYIWRSPWTGGYLETLGGSKCLHLASTGHLETIWDSAYVHTQIIHTLDILTQIVIFRTSTQVNPHVEESSVFHVQV